MHLWHCRYGHLNFWGLHTLSQHNMVYGLSIMKVPIKLCKDCLIGKQSRDSFPKKSTWRATQVLQLVHADICGPMTPISNIKKRYLLTFIDDFSRKTWIYFLTEKSEAFSAFKNFKIHVEKEVESLIGGLRTDRGGEFTNFCCENGIRRQLTTSYTPQQNGIVERKNITIMNMVRSMLLEKKMPKNFWAEAATWSVHILN